MTKSNNTEAADAIRPWPTGKTPRSKFAPKTPAKYWHYRGIAPETVERIGKAAGMVASGKSMAEAARALGMRQQSSLHQLRRKYPDLWESAYSAAAGRVATAIEAARQAVEEDLQAAMKRAVELQAYGKSLARIEREDGIRAQQIVRWQTEHSEQWAALEHQAFAAVQSQTHAGVIEKVRKMAGTDAILQDPDTYLSMADAADKWTKARGESLFATDGEMTLTRFFDEWYKPQRLFQASPGTLKLWECRLKRWRLLTGNPPLTAITPGVLAKFRDALMRTSGQKKNVPASSATVRSALRLIQAVLDKAGPPGRGNRDAAGILPTPPWVRPPREEQLIPKTIRLELLGAVYAAAVSMRWPKLPGIDAPTWWRALLAVCYNSGGLRWRTLFALRMTDVDWTGQRLVIPAERMKSHRPIIVHLNETAMEHLRAIRTDRELVFEWPYDQSWFHRCFAWLQQQAGVSKGEYFGLHTIRKTAATMLWQESPAAAQFALGHTAMEITRKHYVDGGALVATALDHLPQPTAFAGGNRPA
jgi:integrase